MKILRNVCLGFLLSLGLTQSQAQAGLIVGVTIGNPALGAAIGGGLGLAIAIGNSEDELEFLLWGVLYGVPGIILDYSFDNKTSLGQIEVAIRQSLPMIEDHELIREIAEQAQAKLVTEGKTQSIGEKRVIKFSNAEVETFTESLVLSGAEREEIRRVLQ